MEKLEAPKTSESCDKTSDLNGDKKVVLDSGNGQKLQFVVPVKEVPKMEESSCDIRQDIVVDFDRKQEVLKNIASSCDTEQSQESIGNISGSGEQNNVIEDKSKQQSICATLPAEPTIIHPEDVKLAFEDAKPQVADAKLNAKDQGTSETADLKLGDNVKLPDTVPKSKAENGKSKIVLEDKVEIPKHLSNGLGSTSSDASPIADEKCDLSVKECNIPSVQEINIADKYLHDPKISDLKADEGIDPMQVMEKKIPQVEKPELEKPKVDVHQVHNGKDLKCIETESKGSQQEIGVKVDSAGVGIVASVVGKEPVEIIEDAAVHTEKPHEEHRGNNKETDSIEKDLQKTSAGSASKSPEIQKSQPSDKSPVSILKTEAIEVKNSEENLAGISGNVFHDSTKEAEKSESSGEMSGVPIDSVKREVNGFTESCEEKVLHASTNEKKCEIQEDSLKAAIQKGTLLSEGTIPIVLGEEGKDAPEKDSKLKQLQDPFKMKEKPNESVQVVQADQGIKEQPISESGNGEKCIFEERPNVICQDINQDILKKSPDQDMMTADSQTISKPEFPTQEHVEVGTKSESIEGPAHVRTSEISEKISHLDLIREVKLTDHLESNLPETKLAAEDAECSEQAETIPDVAVKMTTKDSDHSSKIADDLKTIAVESARPDEAKLKESDESIHVKCDDLIPGKEITGIAKEAQIEDTNISESKPAEQRDIINAQSKVAVGGSSEEVIEKVSVLDKPEEIQVPINHKDKTLEAAVQEEIVCKDAELQESDRSAFDVQSENNGTRQEGVQDVSEKVASQGMTADKDLKGSKPEATGQDIVIACDLQSKEDGTSIHIETTQVVTKEASVKDLTQGIKDQELIGSESIVEKNDQVVIAGETEVEEKIEDVVKVVPTIDLTQVTKDHHLIGGVETIVQKDLVVSGEMQAEEMDKSAHSEVSLDDTKAVSVEDTVQDDMGHEKLKHILPDTVQQLDLVVDNSSAEKMNEISGKELTHDDVQLDRLKEILSEDTETKQVVIEGDSRLEEEKGRVAEETLDLVKEVDDKRAIESQEIKGDIVQPSEEVEHVVTDEKLISEVGESNLVEESEGITHDSKPDLVESNKQIRISEPVSEDVVAAEGKTEDMEKLEVELSPGDTIHEDSIEDVDKDIQGSKDQTRDSEVSPEEKSIQPKVDDSLPEDKEKSTDVEEQVADEESKKEEVEKDMEQPIEMTDEHKEEIEDGSKLGEESIQVEIISEDHIVKSIKLDLITPDKELQQSSADSQIIPDEAKAEDDAAKEGDHDSGVDESTQGKLEAVEENQKTPTKSQLPRFEGNGSLEKGKGKQSIATPRSKDLSDSAVKSPIKSAAAKGPSSSTGTTPARTPPVPDKKVPMNKVVVGTAPSPNIKVVKSKIGSMQNVKHKPGGGQVKLETKKIDLTSVKPKVGSTDYVAHKPGGGDKKVVSAKLEWKAQSKIGSLDNAQHKPGGGEKKIETVKLNFKDKAKPKVGSTGNIKHKPGGGQVQIEDHKLDIKAKSKIGSFENAQHKPGGGNVQIFDEKTYYHRQESSSKTNSDGHVSGEQSPVSEFPPSPIKGQGTNGGNAQ